MSSSKKLTLKRDFAACVYLSEAPSPPRFLLGWCRNFVGSESGQIHSVKLLQNMVFMVFNRTPYPPPPLHNMDTYIQYTYSHMEGGRGEGELNQIEG